MTDQTTTPEAGDSTASNSTRLLSALNDRRCHSANNRIPDRFKQLDVFWDGETLVFLGNPDSDDESHSCDCMGCGTLDHVLHRVYLGG